MKTNEDFNSRYNSQNLLYFDFRSSPQAEKANEQQFQITKTKIQFPS